MSALLGIVEDIGIRQQLLEVFSNVENGTPDNISKFGCLALAKKGAVVWNAWRNNFQSVAKLNEEMFFKNTANFSGMEINITDFKKFNFGMDCNFENTYFLNEVDFFEVNFDRSVSFKGAKFSKSAKFNKIKFPKVSFQDVAFLDDVQFNFAQFNETANFFCAEFQSTWFYETRFFKEVSFEQTKFLQSALFRKTEFDDVVNFNNVKFESTADFIGSQFSLEMRLNEQRIVRFSNSEFNLVLFDDASFNVDLDFSGSVFNDDVSFKRAIFFEKNLIFKNLIFLKNIDFSGASFPSCTLFINITIKKKAIFIGVDYRNFKITNEKKLDKLKYLLENKDIVFNDFQTVKFLGCNFEGEVNFANRIFKNTCLFEVSTASIHSDSKRHKTRFAIAPKFHNCEIHQDTSFDGAEFPEATGSEEASRAYRTLKLAFNKMQAVREEQLFFKLEMAEEAKSAIGIRKFLFSIYEKLSDYGFDFYRPIKYLILSMIVFGLIFGALSLFTQCSINLFHLASTNEHVISNCHFSPKWFEFVVVQALPIPGLDKISENAKSEIFSNNAWLSLMITVLVIVQKSLSLLFLFFIGLALKNQFKFK